MKKPELIRQSNTIPSNKQEEYYYNQGQNAMFRKFEAYCKECKAKVSREEIYRKLLKAKDELLCCYRLGRRPTEKLLNTLDKLGNLINKGEGE